MVRIDKPMSARTKYDVSYKFSKVSFMVIFHSEFSSKLTFEDMGWLRLVGSFKL